MTELLGYELTGVLRESQDTVLYRGVRTSDASPVVVKMLRSGRFSPQEAVRLRNEREIGRLIDSPYVVKVLGLESSERGPALILEDFGGEPLDLLLTGSMEIGLFLRIALKAAKALADIHARGIAHKDIKPQNLIVDMGTLDVKLTDFGIAASPELELRGLEPTRLIEGTLAYISPEQTGRTECLVDYRTDFYSLGVTFYLMLTGVLPFKANDPLEWFHAHIAREPVPVRDRVPTVPSALSALVMKLLSKSAEDRYQSAEGLRYDLECALNEWEASAKIPSFPLGQKDIPELFRVPRRLYGRSHEIESLYWCFEQAQTDTPSLVLVAGYSGAGKSTLVHELQKPVAARRGYFASGKFDQYSRGMPLATVAQAVDDLARQLLIESEGALLSWKRRLSEAVGANGRLLTEVFPVLELILGPQPALPDLPPAESRNRFHRAFLSFLGAFAHPEHPLVLFFDDLQWADTNSLALIELILTNPELGYLMIVGAYRDNGFDAIQPPLSALRNRGVIINEIKLGPLQGSDVAQLVADTLRMPAPELARHVFEKTRGNPLFATRFLVMLHDEGLLRFDAQARQWRWDLSEIQAQSYAENVVGLTLLKLNKLSESTRNLLWIAAGLGLRAESKTLEAVTGHSEERVAALLQEAVREGLIWGDKGGYRFLHDRIRQAAYLLIPAEERALKHLEIGRAWLSHLNPEDVEEKVFELVEQFNQGAALIESREEGRHIARLNLNAGLKAMRSTSYGAAADFFAVGIGLITRLCGEEAWREDYDLAYALHFARARCEWFNGQAEESEELLRQLLSRARTSVERGAIFDIRVNICTTRGDIKRSLAIALEGISLFGIRLESHPSEEAVRVKLQAVREAMSDRSIESLIYLPSMADPDMKAAMRILGSLITPSFFSDQNLFCLVLCHMVELSLKFGNADASAVGYVFFGIILGPMFGYYAEGYRFGLVACELVERENFVASKALVYSSFGDSINYWTRHIRADLPYLRKSFTAALEAGNLEWACYACNHIVTCLLMMGAPLIEVMRESESQIEFVRRARFDGVVTIIVCIQRFVRNMLGQTAGFSTFDGDGFSETDFEASLSESPMATLVCWYWILKLQARFISGDFDQAFAAADKARPLLWSSLGHLQVIEYHYYRALAAAVLYDREVPERRTELLRELIEQRDRFSEWAMNGPENFENRYALISAEIARIEGRANEAMRLYDEAIASSARNGFVQNEAVACEMAARFYRSQGFERIERAYLREARSRYAAWGADGKTRQLDALYAGLFEPDVRESTATFAASSAQLDLMAVLKASQTISSEILMPQLTKTLLKVAAQAAGAQRGWLLLYREGEFKSAATVGDGTEDAAIPNSIVNYAHRTRAPVLLDHLSANALFSSDPAFSSRLRPPLSVLCLPISRASEVEGLLYLEHDAIRGAFTSERLAVLELLAGQAAISLENARLYQQSLEAVRMREEFLSVASHELRTPLTPLKLQIQTLAALSRAGDLSSSPRDKLDRLLENSDRQITQLSKLLDNLLDVSCVSTGQLDMAEVPIDFSELVQDAIARMRPSFEHAGSSLAVDVKQGMWVRGDVTRLEQVVNNLLSNAARYGAGKPVEVRLLVVADQAMLMVRDFGIGIARENQERIFRRFDRAQQSTRNFGGFGLGLYLTREVLKALGGSIRVESRPGEGSCFVVELPLLVQDQGNSSRVAHSARKVGPPLWP